MWEPDSPQGPAQGLNQDGGRQGYLGQGRANILPRACALRAGVFCHSPPPRTQRKWSLVGKGEEMRGPDGGSLADSEAR